MSTPPKTDPDFELDPPHFEEPPRPRALPRLEDLFPGSRGKRRPPGYRAIPDEWPADAPTVGHYNAKDAGGAVTVELDLSDLEPPAPVMPGGTAREAGRDEVQGMPILAWAVYDRSTQPGWSQASPCSRYVTVALTVLPTPERLTGHGLVHGATLAATAGSEEEARELARNMSEVNRVLDS